MYKPLYCGNPLCYPVTQPLNSPPCGQPVLLDFCVDLQLYFMHMQGNKLYFFLPFFFFCRSFYCDNKKLQNVSGISQETFAQGSVGQVWLCWVQLDVAGFEPGLLQVSLILGL